jgi:hypothetical protein
MKTWLTVAEGAEYSGVSRDTIYTACERRELLNAASSSGGKGARATECGWEAGIRSHSGRAIARPDVTEDGPDQPRERAWKSERVWLGGRDSNPDNLLQRQMSYRWTTSQCQSQRANHRL